MSFGRWGVGRGSWGKLVCFCAPAFGFIMEKYCQNGFIMEKCLHKVVIMENCCQKWGYNGKISPFGWL